MTEAPGLLEEPGRNPRWWNEAAYGRCSAALSTLNAVSKPPALYSALPDPKAAKLAAVGMLKVVVVQFGLLGSL